MYTCIGRRLASGETDSTLITRGLGVIAWNSRPLFSADVLQFIHHVKHELVPSESPYTVTPPVAFH